MKVKPMKIITLYLLSWILFFTACNDSVPATSGNPTTEVGTVTALKIESLHPNTDGEVKFQGSVMENDLGCEVDGLCLLRVLVQEQMVTVIYHYGEWPPCENGQATQQGFEISPNDQVEVFGSVYEENAISTCDSESYYIRKISND